jgi:hypothetical protein
VNKQISKQSTVWYELQSSTHKAASFSKFVTNIANIISLSVVPWMSWKALSEMRAIMLRLTCLKYGTVPLCMKLLNRLIIMRKNYEGSEGMRGTGLEVVVHEAVEYINNEKE